MPEARRPRALLSVFATVALVFSIVVFSSAAASAQGGASKAGGGVFPLTPIWTATLESLPDLAAYDENRAYVVLAAEPDRGVPTARLTAISLGNGSVRWSRAVENAIALAIGDDLVFTFDGKLLQAFSTDEGEPRWQLPLAAPLAAPMHVEGGWLVLATQASDALAIRARDGATIWRVHLPSPASGEPEVAGSAVYLPLADKRVLRLHLETGAVVWDQKILSQPLTILPLDDRIFVGTAQRWFYALDPENGKVHWRFAVGLSATGMPAAGRGHVYFLALDNLLRALSREGGSLKWRQILVHRELYGPFRARNLLLVCGTSPAVHAYDAATGAPAGSYDAPDDLAAPIHIVRGLLETDFLVLALTGEGQMIALRPQSLQPEAFSVSPRTYLMTGFPVWKW